MQKQKKVKNLKNKLWLWHTSLASGPATCHTDYTLYFSGRTISLLRTKDKLRSFFFFILESFENEAWCHFQTRAWQQRIGRGYTHFCLINQQQNQKELWTTKTNAKKHIQIESERKLITRTEIDQHHLSDHSEVLHLPVTEKETKPRAGVVERCLICFHHQMSQSKNKQMKQKSYQSDDTSQLHRKTTKKNYWGTNISYPSSYQLSKRRNPRKAISKSTYLCSSKTKRNFWTNKQIQKKDIQIERTTKLISRTDTNQHHSSDHSEVLHLPVIEKETKPQEPSGMMFELFPSSNESKQKRVSKTNQNKKKLEWRQITAALSTNGQENQTTPLPVNRARGAKP